MSVKIRINPLNGKQKLLAVLLCAPFVLTACGGKSSSGTVDSSSTITGQATKGPIDSATVSVYAINENGSRGEYLATTVADAKGRFSVSVDHSGAAAVVVTGGSYVDEATGESVSLSAGAELETFVADVKASQSVAVTALTTIAAKRAAAKASAGLETAIASANAEVAAAFGLSGVDIAATLPADVSSSEGSGASVNAKRYGLVQAGLTQHAETSGIAPASVLTLVADLSADFTDGRIDGRSAAGASLTAAGAMAPMQAMAGLNIAMSAFVSSPENRSGMSMPDITIPTVGVELSGQATKGPIAEATVSVYALNEDGTRGRLLGQTMSDAAGDYSLQVDHQGPSTVVVTGGSYRDEATGSTVVLGAEVELETLVPNLEQKNTVAVTALTTIAAERAKANAARGLSEAIAAANTEVAASFGLAGVDLTATIPSDMSSPNSMDDSADAQGYGLVQSGLTQLAMSNNMGPEEVLALVRGLAEDFSDGRLDGMTAAGAAISVALEVTPAEAMAGLEAAMSAFASGSQNASGSVEIPNRR